MVILVSGSTATLRELNDPLFGALFVPEGGNNPPTLPAVCAIDNGAYSAFHADKYVTLLARFRHRRGFRFAVAPDVVGNAAKTLAHFETWEPVVRAFGYPVALAATVNTTPWDRLGALFIGGTTRWKLGPVARELVAYAKARGLWVHMGRVNEQRRLEYADLIGCDSVDGSRRRWGKVWLPVDQQWDRGKHQRRQENPKLWDSSI